MSSAICFNLDLSKVLSSGNELSLPKDKILHNSKFKAFADDNLHVAVTMKFVLYGSENIAGVSRYNGCLRTCCLTHYDTIQSFSNPKVLVD